MTSVPSKNLSAPFCAVSLLDVVVMKIDEIAFLKISVFLLFLATLGCKSEKKYPKIFLNLPKTQDINFIDVIFPKKYF
jgi:hypothetical protein